MSAKIVRPRKILVFLPAAGANMIVAKLAERGHEAIAVSTVPELFDALRSDNCCFAITTRPEIDLLRGIRSIPVVNLEIFFHAAPSGDGPLMLSKRFDGSAFMKRIEFLVQSSMIEADAAVVDQARDGRMPEHKVHRWWAAAKDMLGLPRGPKESGGVLSCAKSR